MNRINPIHNIYKGKNINLIMTKKRVDITLDNDIILYGLGYLIDGEVVIPVFEVDVKGVAYDLTLVPRSEESCHV